MSIKFKLNLQLHAGIFDVEGSVNPILADDNTDVEDFTDDNDTNIPNDDLKADTEATEATKNTQTPDTSVDFNGITSKLDMLLNKMDTPKEEVAQIKEEVAQLSEEDIEKMNNDFYIEFSEKPLDAIEKLIEQRSNEKVAPFKDYIQNIQKMEYWKQKIHEFGSEHPDFDEYSNDISKLLQENTDIKNSSNPLELAYKVVKADKLDAKIRPLDEQLKDADMMKKIMSNPELKNLIIKELKLSKGDIPNVIGSEGTTSVNVSAKPKTMEEATKAWLNS